MMLKKTLPTFIEW